MNGAVVGKRRRTSGWSVARRSRSSICRLPNRRRGPAEPLQGHRDRSFGRRGRREKQTTVSAEATDEIRADDILVEFPVDPTQPFQLRVPDALPCARPRRSSRRSCPRGDRDIATNTVPPAAERVAPGAPAWIFAAVIGASVGVVFAAAIAKYESAPIPSAPAHTFKGGAARRKNRRAATRRCSATAVMVPHRQRRQPSPALAADPTSVAMSDQGSIDPQRKFSPLALEGPRSRALRRPAPRTCGGRRTLEDLEEKLTDETLGARAPRSKGAIKRV